MIPEPSVSIIRDNYKKAIKEKRIVRWQETSEYPAWVKVGEVSISPFFDDIGICTHLVGSVHDITERKRAEENLEKESRMRTALLDNIPGCIALILKKGTREIVASNRFGREIGAVPGQTCFKTCAERDDNCPFCLAPKLWKTDQSQKLEVEYRGTWYEEIWVPLSESLYVHYVFDITERKRSEEALRKSEEQLRQSQKLESVGSLAGGIAHDFNNLLTTILGYSELIFMEENLNDTTKEGVQEIKNSAERAAALTQQLLAFSRKQVLQPQVIDLNRLITGLGKMLKRLVSEDIDFTIKYVLLLSLRPCFISSVRTRQTSNFKRG